MSDVLYGNLIDEQPLQGRMVDKVIAFEKYDDTEVKAGIAANKAAIEALDTKVDTNIAAAKAELNTAIGNTNNAVTALETKHDAEMEALEAKHDADQAQNVVDHNELRRMSELAGRKIQALTDLLNGKELAFDTQEYNENPVAVPSGAVADTLIKVGGKSMVWNQVAKFVNHSETRNGVTFISSIDGTITANGTATSDVVYNPSWFGFAVNRAAHKYFVVGCPDGGGNDSYNIGVLYFNYPSDNGQGSIWVDSSNVTQYTDYMVIKIKGGITVNNLVFKPRLFDLTQMFGPGNEPTTVDDPRIKIIKQYAEAHPEYNAGEIISSQTDEVVVRGKNLVRGFVQKEYVNNDGNGFITITTNTAHCRTELIEVEPNAKYFIYPALSSGNWGAWFDENKNGVGGISGYNKVVTAPSNAKYIACTVSFNDSNPDFANNFYIAKESAFSGYKPYTSVTHVTNFPVLRSAGSVYDYIDLNKGELHRRVGVVDLGTLEWRKQASNTYPVNRFDSVYELQDIVSDSNWGSGLLCAKYEGSKIPITGSTEDKKIARYQKRVYISDSSYNDTAEFKSAMNGVMLYYELAEEVVTDIEPIPELEAINVESGGEIRFVNHDEAFNMQIPSTHEWVVRNSEV